MPFWQSSSSASHDQAHAAPRQAQDPAASITQAQLALTKARRNLLGAGVLLLAAFLLLPWVLDKKPRAWGDDVILSMPKAGVPVQKNPSANPAADSTLPPAPIDSTSPLKPSQPSAAPEVPAPTAPSPVKANP